MLHLNSFINPRRWRSKLIATKRPSASSTGEPELPPTISRPSASATPAEFAGAFSYLDGELPDIRCEDWRLLDGLNKLIEDNQLGAPVKFDFKRGCPS